MPDRWNALQWDGEPGHYEVYYLTFTDPAIGRRLLDPLHDGGAAARDRGGGDLLAVVHGDGPRRPVRERGGEGELPGLRSCSARGEPVRAADRRRGAERHAACRARSSATGAAASGTCAGSPRCRPTATCTRSCARAGIAKTVLFLPHPDVEVVRHGRRGTGGASRSRGAQGGQAHLWGSKHATRWAWVHCSDFGETRRTAAPSSTA